MSGAPIRLRGPLAQSYPSAVLLVVFALTPYLVLSTALTPLATLVGKDVGLSQQSLALTNGMANAAYAIGTVTAVQLAVHLRGRRLLVLYASMFILGSVFAAAAWTPGFFVAGRVMQGFFTSLMLIAAVPPLVAGWPASTVPYTAATMNMCIFGAVALGPVVGGYEAGAGEWHPLFWIVTGLGALALLFALLTFEDQDPQDPSAPWDWVAQALAGAGCAAAFFGAAQLTSHSIMSTIAFVPLVCGLGAIVVLVAFEYRAERPLMRIRSLATTIPIAGILMAMCAAAASVAVIELAQTALSSTTSPTHQGTLFWPQFGAAFITAVLFGIVVRTRYLPVIPFVGLAVLGGGAAVLSAVAGGTGDAVVLVGSGLVGVGVGAAVAPALFMTGFSQRSDQIQRIFALVELLRAVAAFVAAPVLLHFAENFAAGPSAGTNTAVWICVAIAAGGLIVAAFVVIGGRMRMQRPRLERWLEGDAPALDSPPLGAGIRRRFSPPAARRARAARAPASPASSRRARGPRGR